MLPANLDTESELDNQLMLPQTKGVMASAAWDTLVSPVKFLEAAATRKENFQI